MNPDDPLAKYRKKKEAPIVEQPNAENPVEEPVKEEDPLAKYRKGSSKQKKDFLLDQLAESGTLEQKVLAETRRNEGKFGRGVLSGATFGLSAGVPGLETQGEGGFSTAGDIVGSTALPFGWATKGARFALSPIIKLAKNSPKIMKGLNSLANLTGVATIGAATGAGHEATEEGGFKLPSVENALEHGATWAALDLALSGLGWTGRFAKNLLKKSNKLGKSKVEVLNETIEKLKEQGVNVETDEKIAQKALSILEDKPVAQIEKEIRLSEKPGMTKEEEVANKVLAENVQQGASDLKNRKVEQVKFDKLDKNAVKLAEPYLPKEFEAAEVAEEAINRELDQSIDSIAPRAETEQELGKNVQTALEDASNEARKVYNPLYEKAEEVAKTIHTVPLNTANKAVELLKKLEGVKVKPVGYDKVIRELTNALEDAGFVLRRSEHDNSIIEGISSGEVTVSKIMDLKRRLNKMANFDNIESSVQDLLGILGASVKKDVLKGLEKSPEALKAFQEAEKKFGETAEKFKRKSIKSARYTEKPESIAKLIRTPSALEDIKRIVPQEQYAQIERELLEHMKGLKEDRARAFYREMRPHLGNDARSVAEQIIESKIPPANPTRKAMQREKIQQGIYDDISKATLTGQRPETTLKLWKTKEGQQLIKNSLKGNPNEKEILKYLEDQSFADFSASVVSPDGTIDFKKFNELMKDPATVENIRLMGGEDAVNFFKHLETLSKHVEKNISAIEGKIDKLPASERNKINKVIFEKANERLKNVSKRKLTKEQELFEKTHGEKARLAGEEEINKAKVKGEERFRNMREANEDKRLLNEQREKNKLLNRIDDFLRSYGTKAKGLLAIIGAIKFGPENTLVAGASYEALKYLLKNKKVRDAVRQAASKSKSTQIGPLINAITKIEEESLKED